MNHNVKFLVITQQQQVQNRTDISSILHNLVVINFVVIFERLGQVFANYENVSITLDKIDNGTIAWIFPNHLTYQTNSKHMIVVTEEVPRVRIQNRIVISKYRYLLESISKKENSIMMFRELRGPLQLVSKEYFRMYNNRQFLMTLNTVFVTENPAPQLMTYEETGLCPLVPVIEQASTKFHFMEVLIRFFFFIHKISLIN